MSRSKCDNLIGASVIGQEPQMGYKQSPTSRKTHQKGKYYRHQTHNGTLVLSLAQIPLKKLTRPGVHERRR